MTPVNEKEIDSSGGPGSSQNVHTSVLYSCYSSVTSSSLTGINQYCENSHRKELKAASQSIIHCDGIELSPTSCEQKSVENIQVGADYAHISVKQVCL